MSVEAESNRRQAPSTAKAIVTGAVEAGILIAAIYWMHGTPAPEVNEPHYLSKAKHFWDPSWCAKDIFLDSADVHLVFECLFGWLTLYFPLPVVAWIGRGVAWTTLSIAWCYLVRAITPRIGAATAAGLLLLLGVKHFHLAGEWLAGGIEAKSLSFPFVFLGIALFLRNRWRAACVSLGAATAMHVLTGGWAFLAMVLSQVAIRRDVWSWRFVQGVVLAGVVAAPGILPALLGTRSDPQIAQEAYQIYVYERLPHHLLLREMAQERKLWFGVLTAAWLVLAPLSLAVTVRRCRDSEEERLLRVVCLQSVVAATLLFAIVGALLDQYSRIRPVDAAGLLRFYWFRASDVFVPLGFAIAAVTIAGHLLRSKALSYGGLAALIAVAGVYAYRDGVAERRLSVPRADASVIPHNQTKEHSRSATHRDWVRVCEWISRETPLDAVVWSARRQQSFKWYAQRAEVHNYKDVPQDPAGLLEWRRRLELVRSIARRGGLWNLSREEILVLQDQYGFSYVILYKSGTHRPLPFERVYPLPPDENRHYEVYRLPPLEGETR